MQLLIRIGGLIGYLVVALKVLARNLVPYLNIIGEFIWVYARTGIISLGMLGGLYSLGIAPSPLLFLHTPFNQLPRLTQLKFGVIFAGVISNFRINGTDKNPGFMQGLYIFWFPVLNLITNLIVPNLQDLAIDESEDQLEYEEPIKSDENSISAFAGKCFNLFVAAIQHMRGGLTRSMSTMHKEAMEGSESGESLMREYVGTATQAIASRLYTPAHNASLANASTNEEGASSSRCKLSIYQI